MLKLCVSLANWTDETAQLSYAHTLSSRTATSMKYSPHFQPPVTEIQRLWRTTTPLNLRKLVNLTLKIVVGVTARRHTYIATATEPRVLVSETWDGAEKHVYRCTGRGFLTVACGSVGHVSGLTSNFENYDNGG